MAKRDTSLRDTVFQELSSRRDKIEYSIIGSPSSNDTDLIVYIPNDISIRNIPRDQLGDLCHMLDGLFQPLFSKPTNVNIGKIQNGILVAIHKGTKEETNNSILATSKYHRNTLACPILRKVPLNLPQRVVRSLREILAYFDHDGKIGASIRTRYEILRNLRNVSLRTRGNKTMKDVGKTIAFQALQTAEMLHGNECYTKEDLAALYPVAAPLLFRGEWNRVTVQLVLNYFVDFLDVYFIVHPEFLDYNETVENNW